MKNSILLFCLFFIAQFTSAQSGEQFLNIKVVVDTAAIENVNVLNVRTGKSAITDKNGLVKMAAKETDALVVSAVNLEIRRRELTADDLTANPLVIKMSAKVNYLSEVKVNEYSEINSENLGITKRGQKRYSPAERKVRTATTGLIDPLINKISGRTKMLKRQVLIERNERMLIRLDGWYEDKYYTDVLKIPDDYVQGFQYYIIEDPDFSRALIDKNKTLTMFYIKRLALEYNDLIKQEELEEQQITTPQQTKQE